MDELDGKVAIVTGAGRLRGIGRAAALAFARRGADVAITGTGRDPATFPPDEQAVRWKDVHSVAEEVRALGRRALPLVVDVTAAEQVQQMVDRAVAELGRVDILVNNASYARGPERGPLVEMSEEVWRRVLEIKLTGTFLCTRAVVRRLLQQGQGGHIVNISSVAAKLAPANDSLYAVANGGLHPFTMALAKELAPHGINVNCICPGMTDTARNDGAYGYPRGELWHQRIKAVPKGRPGTAEEVAEFIAWLCAPQADYITGQCMNVDGGLVMGY